MPNLSLLSSLSSLRCLRDNLGQVMTQRLSYGTTAKVFHWLIVALLLGQYPLGWLMPDIHRNMQPGAAMTIHISNGVVVLALIALRLCWRLTHPVAPEASLPPWQRITSGSVHWLLYVLVLLTTLTGWSFASYRGWSISLFGVVPLPMLAPQGAAAARAIGGLHETAEWALLIVIGVHVAAALAHLLYYRDGVMQRMWPATWRLPSPRFGEP
jgi:cytochrome b561